MLTMQQIDLETHRFLQKVFDASGRGLLLIDSESRAVLANRLACNWLDVQEGSRVADVLPVLWGVVAPVVGAKQASAEEALLLNGREILAQVAPLIQGEKRTGAVCVLVESRLIERMSRRLPSLMSLSRELDAIIDSSSDGLFVCDGKANVIRMNPASEKIHQTNSRDIVGRNMQELVVDGFIDRSAAYETSQTGKASTLL